VCEPGITLAPKTTATVAYWVKNYVQSAARAGKALKIRASRHKFHSTTSLACPNQEYALPDALGRGPAGPPAPKGGHKGGGVLAVAILQDNMDRVISADEGARTMTVGAGMLVSQLLAEATKRNMSVLVGCAWQGGRPRAAANKAPHAPLIAGRGRRRGTLGSARRTARRQTPGRGRAFLQLAPTHRERACMGPSLARRSSARCRPTPASPSAASSRPAPTAPGT
jgi:hypothetical protein